MNSYIRSHWMSVMSALLVLPIGGCIIICNSGDTPKYKAERTVAVSADMATNVLLSAQTDNGNISVAGRDLNGCEMTAGITARGNSEQEAADLADAVIVTLVPSQQGLTVNIKKPESELAKHISVSLDIKMPAQNRLDLKTSNGNISINNIGLDAVLGTTNGNIYTERTPGPVRANTSNGNVTCRNIGKDIQGHTSNGSIDVVYDAGAANPNLIDLQTSNGSIHITPPQAFSAKVDASTSNGKISAGRPITMQGDFSKTELHGTIGDGKGACRLHTSNGSISIH
jgi:DUF4097 and DUF4098 domain-containing protein YvlB